MTARSDSDGRSGPGAEAARDQARRMMRQGLSDEAIEAATGLTALDILDLRARASVADGARGAGADGSGRGRR